MLALGVAQRPFAVRIADLDQRGDRVDRRVDVGGLLGDDDDPVILAVIGEADAKPVKDAAARRHQKPQVDAVLVSHDAVAVAVEDLELIEAPGEGGDQRDLSPGEDRRPPAQQLLP